jgi:hypothetical protein
MIRCTAGRSAPAIMSSEDGGAAGVVETQRADLADGPKLHVALGAAAQVRIGCELDVAAALASAEVSVASDDAGPAQGSTKGLLQLDLPRQHAPIRAGEDQLGG